MIDPQNRVPLYPGRVTMTPVGGQANTYDMERADQPTQEGTPLNRDTLRKLQADIRTYPIASGYSISAGDVVDVNEDGEIFDLVTESPNINVDIYGNTVKNGTAVASLNKEKSIVFTSFGMNDNGTVFLVDNKKLERLDGTSVESQLVSNHSVSRLTDTTFALGYTYNSAYYVRTGSIGSDGNITLSDKTLSNGNYGCMLAISEDLLFVAQTRNNILECVLFIVSATGDPGGAGSSPLSGYNANKISLALLPDDSSGNHRVCVCFTDAGDSNKGKAVIVTISNSYQITWGNVVTFDAGYINYLSCASKDNLILAAYSFNPVGYVIPITANGNTLTVGTRVQFYSQAYVLGISALSGKFLLAYASAASGNAVIISENGGVLTIGEQYQFNTGETENISVAAISNNQVVVVYKDVVNNSHCYATILSASGEKIAGSFVYNSTTAIALQSGTAGQSIEVIFSGTTYADFVSEGQIIDSDGVYGIGVLDGVLQVWSKDRPGKVFTGSYIGTGTSGSGNPNTLTFDFEPKAIFICGQRASWSTYLPSIGQLFNDGDSSEHVIGFTLGESSNASLSETLAPRVFYGHFSGNTVSWYGYDQYRQLNASGITYSYIAIS